MRSTTIERATDVAVRDGVLLRATVYRGDEPRPVLLVRNPYGEPMSRNVPVMPFLEAGFAVVVQDCRGCGASDGEFIPFENEANDTLDSIQWCAEQDWSTGQVVTYGASY
ncbi:MAG: CocE/NonD family hydrolase, partial [Actinomycetales bacterium]|nr:CocE/NonD family hydrolase [Actinomycetales bacterium]